MKHFILSAVIGFGATSISASTGVGDVLAMRYAFARSNDQVAAQYLERAMERFPQSQRLLDQALIMAIYEQDVEEAKRLLELAKSLETPSEIPTLVSLILAVHQNDFEAVYKTGQNFAFFDQNIMWAWAKASGGDIEAALEGLEKAARKNAEIKPLYDYERAIILATFQQDYSGALDIIGGEEPLFLTQSSYLDYWALRVLAGEDVQSDLHAQFGSRDVWPSELRVILDRAMSGEIDPNLSFASAQNGLSEYIMFTAQQSNIDELPEGVKRLTYLMLPLLAPQRDSYRLHLMSYFYGRQEYDDVLRLAAEISEDSPYRNNSRIYQLRAHLNLEDENSARDLLGIEPQDVHEISFVADGYVQLEEYDKSLELYKEVLSRELDNDTRAQMLFMASLSAMEVKDMEAGIAYMREALKIKPDDSDYLNMLGYTLVDTEIGVEEGLELIEQAVRIKPEPHILDSLGWAYFKVGRFDEAVTPIEYAAKEMAYHPVINAHLGDAYWMVGRKREAFYQWERALDNLEEDLPDITRTEIEDRLANGLSE